MEELIAALGNLVALNGKDKVLDAFIEICDPQQHRPEVRELNPGLDHDWEVLKAARLAMSDRRFVVRVEVDVPQRRGRLGYCGKGSST